jgi:hypothetical protein
MDGSADHPAAEFDDFVDLDGGITQDDAIAWMRVAHGMAEGEAIQRLRDAWNSGYVQVRVIDGWNDDWQHIYQHGEDGAIGLDGEPVHLAPCRRDRASRRERELSSQEEPNEASKGGFIGGIRYNADDLRLEIEKKLDKPPSAKVPQLEQGLGKPKEAVPSTGRRGRPEAPHWTRAHKFIDDWLEVDGCPQPGDGGQAKLEGLVRDLLDECTEEPVAESTIRRHVVKRIVEWKKAVGF